MLKFIQKIFNKKETKISLGRWARTNENIKSIYANSDHCGDIICGDPKKIKDIVNKQKNVKVNLPQNNKMHTQITNTSESEFCCMLIGIGSCRNCSFMSNNSMH
jgi:hypothetical protein